jgi:hypothetical protein
VKQAVHPQRPARRRTSGRNEKPGRNPFDYGALSEPVRRDVMQRAAAIHERIAARKVMESAQDVVEIGQRLQIVRDLIGRKLFQSFLKAEFEWSQGSASKSMRAARVFGDVDCLDSFAPSALYVLSTSRVPAAALPEALELARAGIEIKQSTAHEIVLRCRGESPEVRAIVAARRMFETAVESSECVFDAIGPRIMQVVAGLALYLAHWQSEHGQTASGEKKGRRRAGRTAGSEIPPN